MNINKLVFFICVLICSTFSCSFSQEKQKESTQRVFVLPLIPGSLTIPKERADYLVLHYWDKFDFLDTVYIHLPEVSEQAFIDFIDILPHAEYEHVTRGINKLLSQSEKEESGRMYEYFLELFEKYLYDPNSPYRNDEYYIPVAEYILKNHQSNETELTRARYRLEVMQINRVGEIANDFVYTLVDKSIGRLHDIKSKYTLLYFNNPDCHACAELNVQLRELPIINKLLSNGVLSILAFYPDEDITAWKKHRAHIPDSWINGYDEGVKVENNRLYYLKAIPSLYLLDSDKRVILKDVDFNIFARWLEDKFAYLVPLD